MIEVGIPVYHSKEFLPNALDSLVAQTKKMFIVCLSIDGDGEDYSDIIKEYMRRGLKIRVITNEHGGPGAACQRILETTQCEYLMFLDSDDMLMPQAIRVLSNAIKQGDYDIVRSGFVREEDNKSDIIIPFDVGTVTWRHGKIYKVAYLREKNIRFLPELQTDEDANFNLIAWNCTEHRAQIQDITYYWRSNKSSLTRSLDKAEFFKKTNFYYISGQVKAIKKIAELRPNLMDQVLSLTLVNLYNYYMKARYYQLPEEPLDEILGSLKKYSWMEDFLNNGNNWITMINNLKPGELMEDNTLVFYQEPLNKWITRLFRT